MGRSIDIMFSYVNELIGPVSVFFLFTSTIFVLFFGPPVAFSAPFLSLSAFPGQRWMRYVYLPLRRPVLFRW